VGFGLLNFGLFLSLKLPRWIGELADFGLQILDYKFQDFGILDYRFWITNFRILVFWIIYTPESGSIFPPN
jgi:hypothetical protein